LKSLIWKIWFILFMLLCLVAYFPIILLKLVLPLKHYRRLIRFCVVVWARLTLLSTGSKVEIEGLELLPDATSICFIGNHQGLFDIPLVLGFLGVSCGFIAKKELLKVPVLSWWMLEIPCVFIDRSSARKASESFRKSAAVIKEGHPMVIFPEGTRSRSDQMGDFHAGSFKLPVMAEATIVPLKISGTWRVFEIDKGIHAVPLKLKVFPPITPEHELYKDTRSLAKHLHELLYSEPA